MGGAKRLYTCVFSRVHSNSAATRTARCVGWKLGRNELVGPAGARKSIPSGETETIPTTLALRSVGYRAEPIASTVDGDESSSGVTLPFDERAQVVFNRHGAVIADALSLRKFLDSTSPVGSSAVPRAS